MKSEIELIETKNEMEASTLANASKFPSDIIGFSKQLLHKGVAIIIFLILWEVLPTIGVVDPMFIPAPSTIAVTMWDMILSGSGDFLLNTAISMSRVLLGFGIALLVAIPLGYLLGGFFKSFEKAIDPLLQVLGQLNPFSFFHIVIVFLGIGELSIIAVIFYISQWPVLYNTVTGIKNVNPVLVKMARAEGHERFGLFWKVLLPASLPTVFAGIRLGALLAFFMVMGAEMMGAGDGLGYMIMFDQMYGLIPQMWVGIVSISLLGITFDLVLRQLEKYFTSWKEDVNY